MGCRRSSEASLISTGRSHEKLRQGFVQAPLSLVEQVGHAGLGIWQDVRILIAFIGELSVGLLDAACIHTGFDGRMRF